MLESIDTFGDFEVDPAVVVQWCSQIVVGDVGAEEFGARSRADY